MSQGGQLKRSQKTEFSPPMQGVVMRERSFIKSSRDPQKRRSQTMATIKPKPTMEIYRPPNVRPDLQGTGKLNVYAKEFTMNSDLQSSKSGTNLAMMFDPIQTLQHSKSSGNLLHRMNHPNLIQVMPTPVALPLLHSASTNQILNHLPRVNMNYMNKNHHMNEMLNHPVFSGHNHPIPYTNWNNMYQSNNTQAQLRRSKSLGSADAQNVNRIKNLAKAAEADLGIFAPGDQINLKQAVEDPNQIPSRTLMDLVKVIMEKVVEGIRYCEAAAKLCIAIIEREKNLTFLETLLNTCQQWYQERDQFLRGVKAGDGTKFTAFMWFLTEMCSQLKRHQLKEQLESLQPELVLLSVLAKCCQACVSLPIKCLSETECLFFVLTSIGRDLESELPQQLEQLLDSVRDGFLASTGSPAVARTLLQLIELHASNWQLPGSSVLYYYPRIK